MPDSEELRDQDKDRYLENGEEKDGQMKAENERGYMRAPAERSDAVTVENEGYI